MSAHVLPYAAGPLAHALHVFDLLTTGPQPAGIDGAALPADPENPTGFLPLSQVREWLADHPDAHTARAAIWQAVAAEARAGRPQWRVAAVALATPALTRLARALPGCPCSAEAAVIAEFLDEIDHPRGDCRDWLA